jgi:phosphonate transport system substrate-binding protein
MQRTFVLPLLLALGILLSACVVAVPTAPAAQAPSAATTNEDRADWPEKFVVGFFGGDDADAVMDRNEPFRLYMEERLGMPVELFTGTSYSAVIEGMRADRVDAMLVGPFAYILAVQEAQAEALGVSIGTREEPAVYIPDAPYYYQSVIFTKKGVGISTIEDLKGKDFNFVDPASTSGHLAPKTLLVQLGLDPDTEMNTVFAGSHPTAVISVWNDKAPAGATHEGNLMRLRDEGQIELCWFEDGKTAVRRTQEEIDALFNSCPDGQIAILGIADPIPNTPFAVRTELPDSFKATVKAALLDTINQPELISATSRWYVDPSAEVGVEQLDQFYNSLRDIATLLNLDLKELAEQ